MATQAQSAGTGVVPYRINVRQFEKMIDAGVFPDDANVELLAGILVAMTINDPHAFVVDWLADLLRSLLPAGWRLREEKPVKLDRRWRPQPDIAILRGPAQNYARRAPCPEEIALLVEVADTSYRKDAGIKLRRYATAGVPVYWIVNLARQQIEVYTDPQGQGRMAGYRTMVVRSVTEQVPVVIDGQERGLVAVKELFPNA
jgi:Uma2 family endonuclease